MTKSKEKDNRSNLSKQVGQQLDTAAGQLPTNKIY